MNRGRGEEVDEVEEVESRAGAAGSVEVEACDAWEVAGVNSRVVEEEEGGCTAGWCVWELRDAADPSLLGGGSGSWYPHLQTTTLPSTSVL